MLEKIQKKYYDTFEEKTWINTAHQGKLPKPAVEAAKEAIEWKVNPFNLTSDKFQEVPAQLKDSLSKLINVPPDDIILGNSSSYGLHLLANGIQWEKGDEIILVEGDFPATILPWLNLQNKGVKVKLIKPKNKIVSVEDLEKNVSSDTRLFCTTWVHSFTGHKIDKKSISAFCKEHNIISVLNCAQGIGAMPFDVPDVGVDAITSVGFKWLCGPYGTGFCWINPELRESLEYNQVYWLAMQTADDLKENKSLQIKEDLGARKYDVFGTANFFNFKPLTASVNCLLEIGIDKIEEHDKKLVNYFVEHLDRSRYEIISPLEDKSRSTILIISHRNAELNSRIYNSLVEAGIFTAFRKGQIRISPHVHNSIEDMLKTLDVLHRVK